jgi:hypothetical protein
VNPNSRRAMPLVVLVLCASAWSEPQEPTRTRRFEGELTKVSDESISVRPVKRGDAKDGIEWTVAVDEKTKVVRSVPTNERGKSPRYRTEAGELSDLAVGQHVRVKADAERAAEINILPPPEAQRDR